MDTMAIILTAINSLTMSYCFHFCQRDITHLATCFAFTNSHSRQTSNNCYAYKYLFHLNRIYVIIIKTRRLPLSKKHTKNLGKG